jgi:hypothetical protein
MNDQERIVYLTAALQNLTLSADRYIDDGTWVEHLALDVEFAKGVLKATKYNKADRGIRDAVGRAITGEKNESHNVAKT